MPARLSVQLYSLGDAPTADPAGVVAKLAALGYVDVSLSTGRDPLLSP